MYGYELAQVRQVVGRLHLQGEVGDHVLKVLQHLDMRKVAVEMEQDDVGISDRGYFQHGLPPPIFYYILDLEAMNHSFSCRGYEKVEPRIKSRSETVGASVDGV